MSEEETIEEKPEDLNPYYAKVIGFVDATGNLTTDATQQKFDLLINAGEQHDVKIGERVLVFALGPEMTDPETNESLGFFEVVRGYGKVLSTQTKMAIIRSTKTKTVSYQRPVSGVNAFALGRATEEATREDPAPFTNAKIGDLVRFI